jgi:hypothetical protein
VGKERLGVGAAGGESGEGEDRKLCELLGKGNGVAICQNIM